MATTKGALEGAQKSLTASLLLAEPLPDQTLYRRNKRSSVRGRASAMFPIMEQQVLLFVFG